VRSVVTLRIRDRIILYSQNLHPLQTELIARLLTSIHVWEAPDPQSINIGFQLRMFNQPRVVLILSLLGIGNKTANPGNQETDSLRSLIVSDAVGILVLPAPQWR
jgi:hypothetical protein